MLIKVATNGSITISVGTGIISSYMYYGCCCFHHKYSFQYTAEKPPPPQVCFLLTLKNAYLGTKTIHCTSMLLLLYLAVQNVAVKNMHSALHNRPYDTLFGKISLSWPLTLLCEDVSENLTSRDYRNVSRQYVYTL